MKRAREVKGELCSRTRKETRPVSGREGRRKNTRENQFCKKIELEKCVHTSAVLRRSQRKSGALRPRAPKRQRCEAGRACCAPAGSCLVGQVLRVRRSVARVGAAQRQPA